MKPTCKLQVKIHLRYGQELFVTVRQPGNITIVLRYAGGMYQCSPMDTCQFILTTDPCERRVPAKELEFKAYATGATSSASTAITNPAAATR